MTTRGNIAEKSYNAESGILTFTFSDKTTLDINVKELPAETLILAAAHGISQKGGDSYASAGTKAEEAGLTPVKWAYRQCEAVLDSIKKGEFTRAGAGGGGEPSLIAVALSQITGCTIEAAEDAVEKLTKEQVKALRARPDMAAKIAAIQATRAAARLERANEAAKVAAEKAGSTEALPDLGDLVKASEQPAA